jgi:hypothetical protein
MIIALCSSCQTFQYTQKIAYLDYSFFRERNFFVTETNTVSFPYESLGSIAVLISSGKVYKSTDTNYKPLYQRSGSFKKATLEDTYQLVYDLAKEKGANGILGLKVEYLKPDKFAGKSKSNEGYMISGMTIKK